MNKSQGSQSTIMTRPQPPATSQDGKIEVKVAQIGQESQVIKLDAGANVNKALETAGLNVKRAQIKVNGRKATGETILKQGDIVIVVTKFSQG